MRQSVFIICLIMTGIFPAIKGYGQSQEPIEVTADQALEWDREKTIFVARGNAKAVQGTTSLKAATLTAAYTDGDNGMTINTIKGAGNSVVVTETATGYGENSFYDVNKGYAELTGSNPRIETDTDTLTANGKINYYTKANKMEASGGVIVKNPEQTLKADHVTAFFKKAADGSTALDTVKAKGNVIIETETETLYGDAGDYNAGEKVAIVTGNVRIEKDKNVLTGERAEFDMKTNISKMTASTETGRVKGIFYPGSNKDSDDNSNGQ